MALNQSQQQAAQEELEKLSTRSGFSFATLAAILQDGFPVNQGEEDSTGDGSGSVTFTETLSSDDKTATEKLTFNAVYRQLTSAEVQDLDTPKELLAAQGAGTVVIPLFVWSFVDFNSAAYATNTDITVEWGTSGTDIAVLTGALAATADAVAYEAATADPNEALNQAINIHEVGGAPATGDSPVTVGLFYAAYTI